MRRLFQSRSFIAVALMLQLGAVRCIDAYQSADSAAKTPDPKPASGKICGQLSLVAPEAAQELAAAPAMAGPQPALSPILVPAPPFPRQPLHLSPPGAHLSPLRI